MQSGRLRHKVSLQQLTETQNQETGAMVKAWIEVAEVWARIEPLSAREFIAASATQSEVTARITIRYRAGVTAKMRIVYRDKIYNIAGVLADPKSGLEYLTLPVSEGVNNG
jgi:SPP1 family predicted phage head-tail adaptor